MSRYERQMRKKIENELMRVRGYIHVLRRDLCPEELDTMGDNTPFSSEEDATQEAEAREIQFDLLERLLDKAAGLDQALQRIQDGEYGVCTTCGRPVHRERLDVLPDAAHCLDCQRALEESTPLLDPSAAQWIEAAAMFRERSRYE